MFSRLFFNHLNIGAALVVLGLRLGTSPFFANLTFPQASPPSSKLEALAFSPRLETKTRFNKKTVTQTTILPFQVRYEEDSEMDLGLEKIVQEGKDGLKETDIEITFFEGEEYGQEIVDVRVKNPTTEIVKKGTKKVIREQNTADGKIRYYLKLRVWATSYDRFCLGCVGATYTGTEVKQGTIAVDPKVIPLGTKLYIPNYGFGRAEDIGGAIKGKKIDLGFETLAGQWSARWTDVYLLE